MTFILHAAGCVEAQNNQLNAERARFGPKRGSWVTFCGESDRNLVGIGDFMVYFDTVYQGTVPRR